MNIHHYSVESNIKHAILTHLWVPERQPSCLNLQHGPTPRQVYFYRSFLSVAVEAVQEASVGLGPAVPHVRRLLHELPDSQLDPQVLHTRTFY